MSSEPGPFAKRMGASGRESALTTDTRRFTLHDRARRCVDIVRES